MPKTQYTIPDLSEEDIKRFWSRVDIRSPDECWDWKTSRSNKPIAGKGRRGVFRFQGCDRGAPRVALFLSTGINSSTLFACHSCDHPSCCNPHHLFAGTQQENLDDMVKKGRSAKGNSHGSYTHPECRARGIRNGQHTHPDQTARGERHGLAKLDASKVIDILSNVHGKSARQMARELSVSSSTIERVLRRETWTHIIISSS